MNARPSLISMTAIAVVSDTMLAPFYPQLFAETFGVRDSRHVGIYLAATCFTVMLAVPAWAHVAKRVPTLRLLVCTQLVAGLLSIGCFMAGGLLDFWLMSLAMLVFKGSYLLVYPYMLTLEKKVEHAATIGLLSVVVHLGDITGALLGGSVLQVFEPRYAYLVMASGDFLQMVLCLLLLRSGIPRAPEEAHPDPSAQTPPAHPPIENFLSKLGLVMFVFYFSGFLVRPFFARYWESLSSTAREGSSSSQFASGFVFAIPGIVALCALYLDRRKAPGTRGGPALGLLLGACGLLLQASPLVAAVLAGRVLFGWGLFQSTVRLDLTLFEQSTPDSYATDFGKMNFCQQLGALVSFFTAGAIVPYGLHLPLIVAAAGFVVALVFYNRFFRAEARADKRAMVAS